MNTKLAAALRKPFKYLVRVDFETYYDDEYTLSKMTTADYVRDPRFELIGAGVSALGGPGKSTPAEWLTPEDWAYLAARIPWDQCAFLAHHTHFDGLIAAHHYGVNPIIWLDTLPMARALHGTEVGGSLSKLMHHYGVGEKGDFIARGSAKGKHRRDFTPEEYRDYGVYCCDDVDGCGHLFDRMLPQFNEVSLWSIDTTIRMFTEPTLVLDESKLEAYLKYEQDRKRELLERVVQDKATLVSNDKFAALLSQMGVEPPRKVSPRTGKLTWAFAKTDPGMQDLLEHEDDDIRWLAEARIGVKSTINETRTERLLKSGKGGRSVPIYLKPNGAHTFRWAGGDKMNPQNWERTSETDPNKGVVRKSLLAPEGVELVVSDSGQIEPRVLAWLSGHESLLETFRSNDAKVLRGEKGDVYADFGTTVFGRPISKKDTPIERQVSKNMMLGLGYGMGWRKFAGELLKGMLGSPPVQFTEKDAIQFGVDIQAFAARFGDDVADMHLFNSRLEYDDLLVHCAVTEFFVRFYRERNRPIANLWKHMDVVLQAMDIGNEYHFGPGNCLKTVRHGIVLPNGMVMRYPGLENRHGDGYSYMGGKSGKERVRTYGGSLVENLVQALAKIIVEEQMLWARATLNTHTVNMSHDEILAAVPEGTGEAKLKGMIAIMRTPPEWAPNLPLNAEGDFGYCYGELK